ncbi:MAG: universal stress protein [Bacteroidales bacterium]|jgi:nucleotide-binding universal stress UspA family protein|nr:universal stress protein [Bacteroidales bacterium]
MKLLEKILVPLDFNSDYNKQVEIAGNIALNFNSEVLLLYVLPPEAEVGSVKSMLSEFVDKELDTIGAKFKKKNISYRKLIRYGNVFDKILTVAQDNDVNLILACDGCPAEKGNFSISIVAEKLIRKSQKPVWLIKEGSRNIPKRILCPVDFSDASARALNNATKIARTFSSELFIINVFEPMQENFSNRLRIDYEKENSRLEKQNKEQFDKFLDSFNLAGIKYTIESTRGKPSDAIVEYAREKKIDLLFMGATGKSALQRLLLGSVTEKVVRELPSSIVTMKSENMLNLRIDSDIESLEKHYSQAMKLKETGFYEEAIKQLKISLQVNDLHIPSLNELIILYELTGQEKLAESYRQKVDIILERLWDSKIQLELRKAYKLK